MKRSRRGARNRTSESTRRLTRRPPPTPGLKTVWRVLPVIVVILAAVAVVTSGVVAGMTMAFSRNLPDISPLYLPPSEATRIYAGNGELIASLFRENRAFIPLSQVPQTLQQAVVAVEDDRFYFHHGVDFRGTLRAVWHNLLAGEILEGGSTITQQLARNLFLTQRRQVSRKLAEIMLALEIERRLTKQEILERYLNQVYFGQGAYGVEMAARVYFGKRASDLNLAEDAMLAGLVRAPSVSSPYQNFALAKERQRIVLQRMVELRYINAVQARSALATPVRLAQESNAGLVGIRAPYFISYILPYLLERYGEDLVYSGGLRVYTTLDTELQAAAQAAIREGVDRAQREKLLVTQGALVALDPRTGYIRAMIGGYDFEKSQFNRAWQARRQPGSAFKPFIYVTAIAKGLRTTKIIEDEPVTYEIVGAIPKERIWTPKNYDGKFRGPVSVRQAIEQSINIPAIKTLAEVGPQQVIEYAKRMGITSPLQPHFSLALGTSEVAPLEMATAFGTLATLGVRAEPIAVRKIVDRDGRVLEENLPRRQLVLSSEVAYVMTDLLKGVIDRGTGRAAAIGRPTAGKTGTTDDYRNAWFIGYTPYLSTAVWVGNDDNTPMRKVVGGMVPAQIWGAFMKVAVQRDPPDDWSKPDGVVFATVCGSSGLLASAGCPDPRPEVFIKGTEPSEYDVSSGTTSGNNEPTVTGSLLLTVTAPVNGQTVSSPFAIEGVTVPGALVHLTIKALGGFLNLQMQETQVPVTAQGRFTYVFRPPLKVAGVQYTITLTATSPNGSQATTTLSVKEQ